MYSALNSGVDDVVIEVIDDILCCIAVAVVRIHIVQQHEGIEEYLLVLVS